MEDVSTTTKTMKTTTTTTKVAETNATTTVETQDSITPMSSENPLNFDPKKPEVEYDILKAYLVRTFYLVTAVELRLHSSAKSTLLR